MTKSLSLCACLYALLSIPTTVLAQEDPFAGVKVEAQHVRGHVHMLTGAGGNIGVSVGDDGTLIVDDQYGPLAQRIEAALIALGGERPRIVLNTHYHGDHTGSNAFFGTDGTIIAHDNVRARLVGGDTSRAALPAVTFEDRLRIHYNDDTLEVIHLPRGHTDGDSVVWFKAANVIHLGDHFFNGMFPYIDLDAGGSVSGVIQNLQAVLAMVPENVMIIPGHGPLGSPAELRSNLEMIQATRRIVSSAAAAGQSADEIVAQGLGEAYAGFAWQFITEERWIRILHTDHQNGG